MARWLRSLAAKGTFLVALLVPAALLAVLSAGIDNHLTSGVLVYQRTQPAFTRVGTGSLECRQVLLAPVDAVPCDAVPAEAVTLVDVDEGSMATAPQLASVATTYDAVVEVPAGTPAPAGGEATWIVGRNPPLVADDPLAETKVDGIALGVHGDDLVVAVRTTDLALIAPAMASDPVSVVGVRALVAVPVPPATIP